MDWRKEYGSKIVSAEEAISHVQSGNRIVFTHACGESQVLTEELVRQADRLENVEIVHMVAMGQAPYCQPGMEKHFKHNALFVGGSTRKAVEEGRADYTPCFFHEAPQLLRMEHCRSMSFSCNLANPMKTEIALMAYLLTIRSRQRKLQSWLLLRLIRICLILMGMASTLKILTIS